MHTYIDICAHDVEHKHCCFSGAQGGDGYRHHRHRHPGKVGLVVVVVVMGCGSDSDGGITVSSKGVYLPTHHSHTSVQMTPVPLHTTITHRCTCIITHHSHPCTHTHTHLHNMHTHPHTHRHDSRPASCRRWCLRERWSCGGATRRRRRQPAKTSRCVQNNHIEISSSQHQVSHDTYINIYAHIHTYIHTYIHTRMYTYMYIKYMFKVTRRPPQICVTITHRPWAWASRRRSPSRLLQ